MLESILAHLHQLTQLTARSLRRKRFTMLQLMILEERATPAADLLFSFDPPEMVTVAELSPAAIAQDDAPEAPIVRVDLMPSGATGRTPDVFDMEEMLTANTDSEDAVSADESTETTTEANTVGKEDALVVTEEMLLHVQQTEELRKTAA